MGPARKWTQWVSKSEGIFEGIHEGVEDQRRAWFVSHWLPNGAASTCVGVPLRSAGSHSWRETSVSSYLSAPGAPLRVQVWSALAIRWGKKLLLDVAEMASRSGPPSRPRRECQSLYSKERSRAQSGGSLKRMYVGRLQFTALKAGVAHRREGDSFKHEISVDGRLRILRDGKTCRRINAPRGKVREGAQF